MMTLSAIFKQIDLSVVEIINQGNGEHNSLSVCKAFRMHFEFRIQVSDQNTISSLKKVRMRKMTDLRTEPL